MTRATYPWEQDGFPYWSHLHHARTYWDFRHLPNLLFVHYNDLKADLPAEMRRIARFLDIDVPEHKWPMLVEAATFTAMKRDAAALGPEMDLIFEGGADRFLFKGTNDRWRDVLSGDDLALYEVAARRTLTPLATMARAWRRLGNRPAAMRSDAPSWKASIGAAGLPR